MIIDTHVHYDDEAFDEDRDELLLGLSDEGIGIVVDIGVDIPTSKMAVALSEKYDFIYAVTGFHPSETGKIKDGDFDIISGLVKEHPDKVVAIGEIGLDYHWAKAADEKKNQDKFFREQIALAKELGLPIVIHSRDAAADTMSIIKEEKAYECGGVIHCYSYSPEQARDYVAMGFYIGVGGVLTFKNSKRLKETVIETDLEHIVLETDSPYLSPEPHRGKRNDSKNLKYVISQIAELKGISEDEVINVTEKNARRLYDI